MVRNKYVIIVIIVMCVYEKNPIRNRTLLYHRVGLDEPAAVGVTLFYA